MNWDQFCALSIRDQTRLRLAQRRLREFTRMPQVKRTKLHRLVREMRVKAGQR